MQVSAYDNRKASSMIFKPDEEIPEGINLQDLQKMRADRLLEKVPEMGYDQYDPYG